MVIEERKNKTHWKTKPILNPFFQGGIFSHGKQLDNSWFNFDKKDWQNLKIIGKRDVKKAIDSSISWGVQKGFIEKSWENDLRNFAYSLVNFSAELFLNEEILVEVAGLYKREVINGENFREQELARAVFPKVLQHLNKISARKPKIITQPKLVWQQNIIG